MRHIVCSIYMSLLTLAFNSNQPVYNITSICIQNTILTFTKIKLYSLFIKRRGYVVNFIQGVKGRPLAQKGIRTLDISLLSTSSLRKPSTKTELFNYLMKCQNTVSMSLYLQVLMIPFFFCYQI